MENFAYTTAVVATLYKSKKFSDLLPQKWMTGFFGTEQN